MTRAWKVGERCWVFVDEKPSAARLVRRDGSLWLADNGEGPGTWMAGQSIFVTRLDALIDDAKSIVRHASDMARCGDSDLALQVRNNKRRHRELDRAKKRLAALRAKAGAK